MYRFFVTQLTQAVPHVWSKHVVVTLCIYNNFINLCSFVGFSYRFELLSSRMLRRVSLLTALLYVESTVHDVISQKSSITSISVCAVVTVSKFCGLPEGVSNCHFRSKFVCVLCVSTCSFL